MTITLPSPPRRSQLTVYAAALGAGAGAVAALALSVAGGLAIAPVLVALGVVAGLLAARWETPCLLAYRVTNKAARLFAAAAQTWISLLVFAVMAVAGRAGAPLALEPPTNGSSWMPIPDRSRLRTPGAALRGGVPALVHWMRETRQWWAAPLLPLFLLLRALDVGHGADMPPTNTYTLF